MARGRKRLVLGWGMVGGSVLCAVLFLASLWGTCNLGYGVLGLRVQSGLIEVLYSQSLSGWGFYSNWNSPHPVLWWLNLPGWDVSVGVAEAAWVAEIGEGIRVNVRVELWALFIATITAGAWAVRSGRRLSHSGETRRCGQCRDDRSGFNSTTPCPECGAFPTSSKPG